MEKTFELYNTWFKMQKEFIDTWANAQKDFVDNLIEASKKLQESFLEAGSMREGVPGKELLNFYTNWFNTIITSSRSFTDEVIKMQETWKSSLQKQMETSRDMIRNFTEASRQGDGG